MSVKKSYSSRIASKTNYELIEIFENREKFKDEVILLTIIEMENRGLSHSSLRDVKHHIVQKQSQKAYRRTRIQSSFSKEELERAPKQYSTMAIYTFSVLFGVFFGGTLFVLNLMTAKAKGILETIGFVLLYTAGMVSFFHTRGDVDIALWFFFNAVGGMLLNTLFKRHFLYDLKIYRKRNSLYPLMIGVTMLSLLFILTGVFDSIPV